MDARIAERLDPSGSVVPDPGFTASEAIAIVRMLDSVPLRGSEAKLIAAGIQVKLQRSVEMVAAAGERRPSVPPGTFESPNGDGDTEPA